MYQITDLRDIRTNLLDALFEQEERMWLEQLLWDYRPSLRMIRRFIDGRSLAGYAAVNGRQALGYCFYVLEESKGLIGDLFVMSGPEAPEIGQRLFEETARDIRAIPGMERIEAQLMPFGVALEPLLEVEDFRLHPRQFMLKQIGGPREQEAAREKDGIHLETWHKHSMGECAKLMALAYAAHVDGTINNYYQTATGAMKFLRNIVLAGGCGAFLPEASFLAWAEEVEQPVGAVLASRVAERAGHITQICVKPEYQGRGLGHRMMIASIEALERKNLAALTLTVTSANRNALRLYERMGFRTIREFAAGVWQK
jgi:ribosomal protein S18 acetylase RimI-like enzyme